MFTERGSTNGLTLTQAWLARLRWELQDYPSADREISRALEVAARNETKPLKAFVLLGLADIEIEMFQHQSAEAHLRLVDEVLGQNSFTYHRSHLSAIAARLDTYFGRYPEAVGHASHAWSLARRCGYRSVEIAALYALTEAYLRWGNSRLSAIHGQEAVELCRESGNVLEERRLLRLIGSSQ